MTDIKKTFALVLYDGECDLCVALARRFRGLLVRRDFCLRPLQAPGVRERLGGGEAELLAGLRVLWPDGRTAVGVNAFIEISRCYWWAWPLARLADNALCHRWLERGYGCIARHRRCFGGACRAPGDASHHRLLDFLPLLFLPLAALAGTTRLPAWVFMWAMAFALYAGCKWLTFRDAARRHPPGPVRALGYLLAWPGMDAAAFLKKVAAVPKPLAREWTAALAKTAMGAALLWGLARIVIPVNALAGGWMGMVGVVFLLHFGLFHLLSLAWRAAGVAALPLMRSPALAGSLTEFWGRRWNTAFHELAFRYTFRPLRRLTNPTSALLLVFVLSGLVHELVISLPARGGYGLPTAYFLVQGLGVVAERALRIPRLLGWCFTLLIAAGPVFCLFPPPFINNVILPMLTAIGAT